MREVDIGDNVLSNNVCFEYPSPKKLASHLYSLRTGEELQHTDEIALMSNLIEKYSDFPLFAPGNQQPDGEVIVSSPCLT